MVSGLYRRCYGWFFPFCFTSLSLWPQGFSFLILIVRCLWKLLSFTSLYIYSLFIGHLLFLSPFSQPFLLHSLEERGTSGGAV